MPEKQSENDRDKENEAKRQGKSKRDKYRILCEFGYKCRQCSTD